MLVQFPDLPLGPKQGLGREMGDKEISDIAT